MYVGMSIKSPSKRSSIEFLKFLQPNQYQSASGVEYCAEEVDTLLLSKCTDLEKFDSCSAWHGVISPKVEPKPKAKKKIKPWYLSINPSAEMRTV